jgi:hypothetical protein
MPPLSLLGTGGRSCWRPVDLPFGGRRPALAGDERQAVLSLDDGPAPEAAVEWTLHQGLAGPTDLHPNEKGL